jgi:hypothetical protein
MMRYLSHTFFLLIYFLSGVYSYAADLTVTASLSSDKIDAISEQVSKARSDFQNSCSGASGIAMVGFNFTPGSVHIPNSGDEVPLTFVNGVWTINGLPSVLGGSGTVKVSTTADDLNDAFVKAVEITYSPTIGTTCSSPNANPCATAAAAMSAAITSAWAPAGISVPGATVTAACSSVASNSLGGGVATTGAYVVVPLPSSPKRDYRGF